MKQKYIKKISALVVVAVLGVFTYIAFQSKVFAQVSSMPAPESHTSCLPTKDYENSNGYNESYIRPNNCHSSSVLFQGSSMNTLVDSENIRKRCPAGATLYVHSRAHYPMSPSLSGKYDGGAGGSAHYYCADANGNQFEPIPGESDANPFHTHTQDSLAKLIIVDTNTEYYYSFKSGQWASCPGGIQGPFPQDQSSVNILTGNFPNHFHCKNGNYSTGSTNDNPEAAPISLATQPLSSLVGNISSSDMGVKDQFVDKSPWGSTAPLGTVACLSTNSDKAYYSTTGSCPSANQFPPKASYAVELTKLSTFTAVEAKSGATASIKFNVKNTSTVDANFPLYCDSGFGSFMGHLYYLNNDGTTGAKFNSFAGPTSLPSGNVDIAPGVTKGFEFKFDIPATGSIGTWTSKCYTYPLHSQTRAQMGERKEIQDSLNVIAPIVGPTTSSTLGYCLVRDSSTTIPSYTDPDVGRGYAKRSKPGVTTYDGLKTACNQADFESLMTQYCTQNASSATAQLLFYGSTSSLVGTTTGCAGASCETKTCSAPTISPNSIVVLNPQTQLGSNKYSISISDPDGLKSFIINRSNSRGTVIAGGSTTCPTTQTWPNNSLTIESADFPLTATITDCRVGAAAYIFTVPAPGSGDVIPPTPNPGTAPSAPSSLIATVASNAADVNLTWVDTSNNEMGFRVYRRQNSITNSEWVLDGSTGPNITSYTDSFISAGSYEYKIVAFVMSGTTTLESSPSNLYSATTHTNTPPTPIPPVPNPDPANGKWVRHAWNFSDGVSESSFILKRTDKEYTDFITSIESACRLIPRNKFSWKSNAGDDRSDNWRSFGIPDCSGTNPDGNIPPTPPGPIIKPPVYETRECGPKEMPGMMYTTQSCVMPMYRWNISAQTWEKCDRANIPPYVNMQGNQKATHTNCTGLNLEYDGEWRAELYKLHDPRIDGEWYMPTWNATSEMFRYNPSSDSFEQCVRDSTPLPMMSTMMEYNYSAPCTPVPEKDKNWLLKKFRAEYKMFQLWQRPNPEEKPLPVPPGPIPQKPLPEIGKPVLPPPTPEVPLPIIPKIPVAQCKQYLNGIRQSLNGDKQFWKDVSSQLKNVPKEYENYNLVSELLNQAKDSINTTEKILKKANCASEVLAEVQESQQKLHTEIFSELSGYLPEMHEYVELKQCVAGLQDTVGELKKLLSTSDEKDITDLENFVQRILAKLEEVRKNQEDFSYDAVYECHEFKNEIDPDITPYFRRADKDLNRIISDLVEVKLAPVIEKLTEQAEKRGKKVDELISKVAEIHKSLEEVSKSASEISSKITTSYTAMAQIEEKFEKERTEIQIAKDTLIPLVESALEVMKQKKCVPAQQREALIQEFGTVASVNWLSEKANELEKRLNLFIASCRSNDVAKSDVDAFHNTVVEASEDNQQVSYERGVTPFEDVATHEWYYGGMTFLFKNGFITQGRPYEPVSGQEAILMLMRIAHVGNDELMGVCPVGTLVRNVSPYARCAVKAAQKRGLVLKGDMSIPVQRGQIAQWIADLNLIPVVSKERAAEIISGYTDLRLINEQLQSAITRLVDAQVMVGTITDKTKTWQPNDQLSRAALAVTLQKLFEVR